jgi:hypothetical protein
MGGLGGEPNAVALQGYSAPSSGHERAALNVKKVLRLISERC